MPRGSNPAPPSDDRSPNRRQHRGERPEGETDGASLDSLGPRQGEEEDHEEERDEGERERVTAPSRHEPYVIAADAGLVV